MCKYLNPSNGELSIDIGRSLTKVNPSDKIGVILHWAKCLLFPLPEHSSWFTFRRGQGLISACVDTGHVPAVLP
jgi:hypothetical protein